MCTQGVHSRSVPCCARRACQHASLRQNACPRLHCRCLSQHATPAHKPSPRPAVQVRLCLHSRCALPVWRASFTPLWYPGLSFGIVMHWSGWVWGLQGSHPGPLHLPPPTAGCVPYCLPQPHPAMKPSLVLLALLIGAMVAPRRVRGDAKCRPPRRCRPLPKCSLTPPHLFPLQGIGRSVLHLSGCCR